LALDEPRTQDIVTTINEIQVAIDPIIKPHADRTTLDYNAQVDGLILQGPDTDSCGC
jgi:Fe-S cluster assembly iron-binding protein IscA